MTKKFTQLIIKNTSVANAVGNEQKVVYFPIKNISVLKFLWFIVVNYIIWYRESNFRVICYCQYEVNEAVLIGCNITFPVWAETILAFLPSYTDGRFRTI